MKKSKNTGKPSETAFENTLKFIYGKALHIVEFYDAAHLHGLNKRAVMVPEQPADRLVTANGQTFFAEIKSVLNGTAFPFSMIKSNQLHAARMQVLSGGSYMFMVHNLATDTFYIVPAAEVFATKEAGKESLKWAEMTEWELYETYKSR